MNLIFLGPPGAGKGTYASRVAAKLGIAHISTGDIFRENIKKQTELGKLAEQYINKGELVPDEITIKMTLERLRQPDCEKGFILDGFPRTIAQAEGLEKAGIKIDLVLNFLVPEQVLIERMSGRRTCKKCGAIYHIINLKPKQEGICDKCGGELIQREDEKPKVIKERLKVYAKKTAPLIEFYEQRGLIKNLDGNRPIDVVVDEIINLIQ